MDIAERVDKLDKFIFLTDDIIPTIERTTSKVNLSFTLLCIIYN